MSTKYIPLVLCCVLVISLCVYNVLLCRILLENMESNQKIHYIIRSLSLTDKIKLYGNPPGPGPCVVICDSNAPKLFGIETFVHTIIITYALGLRTRAVVPTFRQPSIINRFHSKDIRKEEEKEEVGKVVRRVLARGYSIILFEKNDIKLEDLRKYKIQHWNVHYSLLGQIKVFIKPYHI
jgi:hypothetical protein